MSALAVATPLVDLLTSVATEAADVADAYSPGGEGLCLPVTAAVCYFLNDRGVEDVQGVCGAWNDDAHWWVRVGPWIVDPTRAQFDGGPLVVMADDPLAALYEAEGQFPPGWTEEHVMLEAERIFLFSGMGRKFGRALLGRLRTEVRP